MLMSPSPNMRIWLITTDHIILDSFCITDKIACQDPSTNGFTVNLDEFLVIAIYKQYYI